MDYNVETLLISNTFRELHLIIPTQLTFFPENLTSVDTVDDFIFTESLVDLRKIMNRENISIDLLGKGEGKYRSRKNADIFLPAIFLAQSFIEDSILFPIFINVLSNYIYDFFKGSFGKKNCHVEFYVETQEKDKVKKINYKGDVAGIKELAKIIKTIK